MDGVTFYNLYVARQTGAVQTTSRVDSEDVQGYCPVSKSRVEILGVGVSDLHLITVINRFVHCC